MSDSPLPTSAPEQVVRFRLRTILIVTAVVAVLAAVAGPFYRRQTPEIRAMLLIHWTATAAIAGMAMYFNWHSSWQLPEKAGAIRCVLWMTGRGVRGFMSRPVGILFLFVSALVLSGFHSHIIANRPGIGGYWYPAIIGVQQGVMFAAFFMIFVPTPLYLCENGVAMAQLLIPWPRIRSAEWTPKNRSVLRLHRLDGDLFVNVPDRMRAGVQKLVAERTRFDEADAMFAPGQ